MQPKKSLAIFLCVSGTCLLFAVIGILLITLWSTFYEAILRGQLTLAPGSTAFNMWVKNPIPLTLTLYLFNWTNPEEIYNKSVKPRFEEMGPYVYVETREKVDMLWNDNDTVTYKHQKFWYFDEQKSKGSLYDPHTSINPVALSAANVVRNWHYIFRNGFDLPLRTLVDSKIWTTHSVKDVLFEGYDDPILTMATKMSILTKSPMMDKFGWFYGRNGSKDYEGIFNIDTGTQDRLGELESWKFSDHTGYYPNECGKFKHASAGDFFPRELTNTSVIKLFSSDLCRYMELEFEKEVVIHGIVGYKYTAGDKFLDNGTKIPENKCFCDGDCMPSGALNVSNCREGSPAFVSLPHFYKADPYYNSVIDGLSPSENKSSFFMIFEPNTGIPLQVSARLQINLRMQEMPGISLFENIPTAYIPILYFEQVILMPESMAFMIKCVIHFRVICLSIGIICISLSVLVFICVFYQMWHRKLFRRTDRMDRTVVKQKEEVPLNQ